MNCVLRNLTACLIAAGVILTGATMQAADGPEGPKLTKGARIVFLGDSITQAGAGPNGYVTQVRDILNKEHPDLNIEVIGAGISGNKVPDLQRRLDKDVIAKKPTTVIIYIGINDVWHSESGRGTSAEDFEAGLKSIIDRIHEAGSQVILSTASVIGEKTDGSNKLDKMLAEYCDISRKVAMDKNVQLLDLNKAFMDYLKENNPENKEKGILTSDRVHLNGPGNEFVAKQMVQALEDGSKTEAAAPKSACADEEKSTDNRVLRHVVLFKFKEGTTPEQIKKIEEAFADLPNKIDSIIGFEHGTDNSPEMLSDGFNHIWIITFKDEKGRDAYLPHAAHQEFVKLLRPHLEQPLVVDFWAEK